MTKPTANVLLNEQKQQTFPLRSGTRQGCARPPLLFNIVLEVPVTAIRPKEEINNIQTGKKEVKLFFPDNMTVYIENPKDPTNKKLELINEFSKIAEYKINIQKLFAFLDTNNKLSERETKKIIPFTIAFFLKALAGWFSWLECHPAHQKNLRVQF